MCSVGDRERKDCEIEFPDGKVIKSLRKGESYKYPGILEADF